MISARTVLLLALIVALASSFGVPTAKLASKAATTSNLSFLKSASIAAPVLLASSPAFAMVDLPTQTLSLEVQFGAYLAVLLGTFLPVLFLINLYIQTESRKAGKAGGQDSE